MAGMRIRTSKSGAMVLSRNHVDFLLQVAASILAPSKGVQVSRGLFHKEMMECEIDRKIGAAGVVLPSVFVTCGYE